ncbi:MAG: DEAD/DEAH box helicase [Gemmatimonadales bacterium]|nr:DEAD/DEAH box helicase [Gemmatimonadales bacterium]
MNFLIADTFTASLARLTGDEQKAAKTTAFDLQVDPSSPGLSFHKLDRAKDKNFWSVRVSRDVRLIVHRTAGSLLLCYVGHHDDAYGWAERRKLETHPVTGAAQLVEIRERVQEIVVPTFLGAPEKAPSAKPALFASVSDQALLEYGVPAEWLGDVRQATEDTLFTVAEYLPQEAAEALLDLATGATPRAPQRMAATEADPFAHPDAQRRFRVVENVEELERALEYPWDKWGVFLHPAQRVVIEKSFNGPARVSGSAGTGKTVVALHRAVSLARRHPEARVLLTTYSDVLANALKLRLGTLAGNEPRLRERIEVAPLDAVAKRLYQAVIGPSAIADDRTVRALLEEASKAEPDQKFTLGFLMSEWEDVVDAWQLGTWEAYRDIPRLGRKTRLPEKQRSVLWKIFTSARAALTARGLVTVADLYSRLAEKVRATGKAPFDYVVVDESQDLTVAQLRFLAAMGTEAPDRHFFAGDLGQRIFQTPFSWKSLGVDIRGRSSTLRVNYRTSHQIREQADRLLGDVSRDVDGNEERRSAVSVFNGPAPEIRVFGNEEVEIAGVAAWLKDRAGEGLRSSELAAFVRSEGQLGRARAAAAKAGLKVRELDPGMDTRGADLSLGTMHLAKGMEFRAVAVMACDDEVLPLQSRIESVTDGSDLEEVYVTERQLLYVACTRARDRLLVTASGPASEFLDDLLGSRNA